MSGKTETSSITEFLSADHQRLAGLWQDCLQGIKAQNSGQIKSAFSEFNKGLRHHIRFEEQVLFPAFEERTGMRDMGPTAVMRSEHRSIEAILDKVAAITEAPDSSAMIQALERTLEEQPVHPSLLFQSHDSKEENILYPMADRMLAEEERRDLIARMEQIA